jgi:hypothetical protein
MSDIAATLRDLPAQVQELIDDRRQLRSELECIRVKVFEEALHTVMVDGHWMTRAEYQTEYGHAPRYGCGIQALLIFRPGSLPGTGGWAVFMEGDRSESFGESNYWTAVLRVDEAFAQSKDKP